MGLRALILSILGITVVTAVIVTVTRPRQTQEQVLIPTLSFNEAVIPRSGLLGQATGIPVNNYSVTASQIGVRIQADEHNLVRCPADYNVALISNATPDPTANRFWGYEYTGTEQANKDAGKVGRELFTGDFYISPRELAFVDPTKLTLYQAINKFTRIDGGPNLYYFMTQSDLCFSCSAGLQNGSMCPDPDVSSSSTSSSSSSSSSSIVSCDETSDCTGAQVCDTSINLCVNQCDNTNDCSTNQQCNVMTGICADECDNDADCTGDQVCDEPAGLCADPCTSSAQCDNGQVCNTTTGVCVNTLSSSSSTSTSTSSSSSSSSSSIPSCDETSDCTGIQVCATAIGLCVNPCDNNNDCSVNQQCNIFTGVCTNECTDDGDCSGAQVCDEPAGLCADPCTTNAQCDNGQVCNTTTGVCVNTLSSSSSTSTSTASSSSSSVPTCNETSDCTGAQVCDTSIDTCVNPCINDAQCGTTEQCDEVTGVCVDICDENSDCVGGQTCNETIGQCADPCTTSAQCDNGQVCNTTTGVCVNPPSSSSSSSSSSSPPSCTTTDDCAGLQVCDTSIDTCVNPCTSNNDCGTTEECNVETGICMDICNDDTDCVGGQTCNEVINQCADPCTTNSQCDNGQVCNTGTGVCVNPSSSSSSQSSQSSSSSSSVQSSPSSSSSSALDAGLTACWSLDEGGGTAVSDSIGTNNGTLVGAEWTTDTPPLLTGSNRALSMSGPGDIITFAGTTDFDFSYGDSFTLSTWIKPTTNNFSTILNKANAATGQGWALGIFNGKLFLSIGQSTAQSLVIQTTNNVTLNQFSHVVASYNGTSLASGMRIWVNGTQQTVTVPVASSAGSPITTEPVRIGNANPGFTGVIDDVRIYDGVLAPSAINSTASCDSLPGTDPIVTSSSSSFSSQSTLSSSSSSSSIPSCNETSDCTGVQVCATAIGLCVDPCDNNNDCAVNQQCNIFTGVCTNECTDDTGCSGAQVCDEPAGICADPCTTNAQCDNGQVCNTTTGVCVNPSSSSSSQSSQSSSSSSSSSTSCTFTSDCLGVQVCDTSIDICVNPCTSNADCGTTEECNVETGICMDICDADVDCLGGQVCDEPAGVCTDPCTDSGDCDNGQTCNTTTGICVNPSSSSSSTSIASSSSSGFPSAPLFACWPFDDLAVNDVITDNTGTHSGTLIEAYAGPSVELPPVAYQNTGSAYLTYSFNTSLAPHSSIVFSPSQDYDLRYDEPFSLTVWVNPTYDSMHQMIVGKTQDTGFFPGWGLFSDWGSVMFEIGSSESDRFLVRTPTVLEAGTWHHITVSYDGSSSPTGMKIFLDGIEQPLAEMESVNPSVPPLTSSPMLLGGFVGTGTGFTTFFDGRVDGLQLYNYQVDPSDVLSATNACGGFPLLVDSCGNGILEPAGRDGIADTADDEECDDGNNDDWDGCFSNCASMIVPDEIRHELVGHWTFDAGTGDVLDYSGFENNGITEVAQGIAWSQDVPSGFGGFSFLSPNINDSDGVDYIRVPTADSLDFRGNQSFSVSVWSKFANSYNAFVHKKDSFLNPQGSGLRGFEFFGDNGSARTVLTRFHYNTENGASVTKTFRTSTQLLNVNTYNNILLVYDASKPTMNERVSIYINGVKETSPVIAGDSSTALPISFENSADMAFGDRWGTAIGNPSLSGFIDDIRVYRGVVTPDDLTPMSVGLVPPGVACHEFNVPTPPLYLASASSLLNSQSWPNYNEIHKIGNEGVSSFTVTDMDTRGIAVDAENGYLYWYEKDFSSAHLSAVRRKRLDGTGSETTLFSGSTFYVNGIAVDPANEKLYISQTTSGTSSDIHVMNTDGTSPQTFSFPSHNAQDIAVDSSAGKLYFTTATAIHRSNLDGTNIEELYVTPVNTTLNELAISPATNAMYWIEYTTGSQIYIIRRAAMDGSGASDFFVPSAPGPTVNIVTVRGLAVDAADGKLYWAMGNPDRGPSVLPPEPKGWIMQADLNGSNVTQAVDILCGFVPYRAIGVDSSASGGIGGDDVGPIDAGTPGGGGGSATAGGGTDGGGSSSSSSSITSSSSPFSFDILDFLDIDDNGTVTVLEAGTQTSRLIGKDGSQTGEPEYDTAFDVNGDGLIDTSDFALVTSFIGTYFTDPQDRGTVKAYYISDTNHDGVLLQSEADATLLLVFAAVGTVAGDAGYNENYDVADDDDQISSSDALIFADTGNDYATPD